MIRQLRDLLREANVHIVTVYNAGSCHNITQELVCRECLHPWGMVQDSIQSPPNRYFSSLAFPGPSLPSLLWWCRLGTSVCFPRRVLSKPRAYASRLAFIRQYTGSHIEAPHQYRYPLLPSCVRTCSYSHTLQCRQLLQSIQRPPPNRYFSALAFTSYVALWWEYFAMDNRFFFTNYVLF